jgi:hypothetical protein
LNQSFLTRVGIPSSRKHLVHSLQTIPHIRPTQPSSMFRYRFFWWHIQVSRSPRDCCVSTVRPIQKEVLMLPLIAINNNELSLHLSPLTCSSSCFPLTEFCEGLVDAQTPIHINSNPSGEAWRSGSHVVNNPPVGTIASACSSAPQAFTLRSGP